MPCEFVQGVALSELESQDSGGYDPDSADGRYPYRENITVSKDSTHTETTSDNETTSNKYIDTRNSGAGTEISASGEDWEVSHIVTGGENNADGPTITTEASSSGGTSNGTVKDSVIVNDNSTEKPPEPQGHEEFLAFDSNAVYDRLDYSKINLNSFVSSPAVDGNSIEVLIPQGEHTGTNMNFDLGNFPGALPTEAWAQMDLYFGPNFHVKEAGKAGGGFAHLTGDGGTGGGSLADGTNGWSARLAFYEPESGGDVRLGTYLYHGEMDGPYGDGELWNDNGEVNVGEWYRITQYVKMNTPGVDNGIYRGWVDGNLAFDKRDIYYRDEGYGDKLRVGNFWLHTYYGGSPTPDQDITVNIDNVTVATKRISNSIEPP